MRTDKSYFKNYRIREITLICSVPLSRNSSNDNEVHILKGGNTMCFSIRFVRGLFILNVFTLKVKKGSKSDADFNRLQLRIAADFDPYTIFLMGRCFWKII